jgi:hypothetical protein
MPVYTDLASAEVKRHVRKLFGITMTRPTRLISDGMTDIWACDVQISERDPTGRIKQYLNTKDDQEDEDPEDDLITGIPGQRPEDWQLDDSLPGHIDTTLRNVQIARNNADLLYADIGAAVVVERSASGNWQITGFSQERPGTYIMYPVDLGTMLIGPVIDISIDTRLLTLAELGETEPEVHPFGSLPFGASAIFEGGVLVRIV